MLPRDGVTKNETETGDGEMSELTQHGENIANEIQEHDAYGYFNVLTLADVWLIVDNLHTHFLDNLPEGGTDEKTSILMMLSRWMRELEDMDGDLPPL